MKKEFYSDINYNRGKRRSAITLNSLLIVVALGTASIFAINKDWVFTIFFSFFVFLPIAMIPMSFKNYPVHGNPIITIEDKEATVMGQKINIKDITKVKVLIELVPSKLDSENIKMLDQIKSVYPEGEFCGNVDVFYIGEDGKKKTIFSHVDKVFDALDAFLWSGVKNYSVRYTVKKNSVLSDFDFKNRIENIKQEKMNKTSQKQKKRQLI